MLPKMSGKFSIWTQLKLIAGAALLLLAALIFGVVLPNRDDHLQSSELEENILSSASFGQPNLNISLLLQNKNSQQQQQLIILSNTTDPVNEQRKDAVLQLIHSLWSAVIEEAKESSSSNNPAESDGQQRQQDRQRTLLLSLSTLWVAGLKEQFTQTWKLLKDAKYLDHPEKNLDLKVSETVVDILGSLLSCHGLTGNTDFLEAAEAVASSLEAAYDNRTGISYPTLSSVASFSSDSFEPDSGLVSSLSEVGGQSLEYLALASLLQNSSETSKRGGDLLLRARVQLLLANLNASKAAEGFYADRLFVPSGIWASSAVTAYQPTKLFYSSLIKSAALQGPAEGSADLLAMFIDAIEPLFNASSASSLIGTSKTGLKFTREYDQSLRAFTELTCMSSEGCYLGAMLALGARELLNHRKKESSFDMEISTQSSLEEATESSLSSDVDVQTSVIEEEEEESTRSKADAWLRLAEELTETCYQAALRNEDNRGLLPDRFCFDDLNEATNRGGGLFNDHWAADQAGPLSRRDHEIRPDLAESYFVLWRQTSDEQYRSKAWQMTQAIERHLKRQRMRRRRYSGDSFEAQASYHQDSSSSSSSSSSSRSSAAVPSPTATRNLLGATLKYLYLVFADPQTTLPLERWVFNGAGQPLPIAATSRLRLRRSQ